jgi:cysteine-rich repeat protein
VVQAGVEQCDDGNASNTDGCLNTCKNPSCGDGFVRAGVEECDDGNQVNTDACLVTCKIAKCGDGVVQAGVDECDDGNGSNTDACINTCKNAKCGDGFVRAGTEECDDGNQVNNDTCNNACQIATLTKWSEGTNQWPDEACNPTYSFGGCNTNAQDHADAWATAVCQKNGYSLGVWTGNKAPGCNGPISMWCGGAIPYNQIYETTCYASDQTKVEITCYP